MFVLLNKHGALHSNSWVTEENVTAVSKYGGEGGWGDARPGLTGHLFMLSSAW